MAKKKIVLEMVGFRISIFSQTYHLAFKYQHKGMTMSDENGFKSM